MSNHTGEALKHSVAYKYEAPLEAMIPAKHLPSVMVCKRQWWIMGCLITVLCACHAGTSARASTS